MATKVASFFADATVIVPALIAGVIGIILLAEGWRFGGVAAFVLAGVGTYGAYWAMRRAACSGALGQGVAAKCAQGASKRAAARAAVTAVRATPALAQMGLEKMRDTFKSGPAQPSEK